MNRKSSGRGRLRSLLVHHQQNKQSIRHKIRNTFFLMIVIPLLIVITATAIVGRIYFGKSFAPGPIHENAVSSAPKPEDISRLNSLLAENPDSLFLNESLAVFYTSRPRQFAVSYKDGIAIAVSKPVTLDEFEILKKEKKKHKSRLSVVWEWSFDYSGAAGKIIFYKDRDSRIRVPFWILLSLVIFMVAVNSVATHRISKHISKPLEKLEKAAVKIGSGDLDFELQAEGAAEVTKLFQSFEEMRKRLKASLEKQEAQEKSRKELVAAISHDLRTPITSIRGHVEGLKDNIPKTEAARKKYLDIIGQQALLLDDMIHNLFLFSKLEIGEIPLHKEIVRLNDFVSSATANYLQVKYPAGKEGNTPPKIIISIPDTIICSIDKKQFKRVIENIIENSIMYNPGSELQINITLEKGRNYFKLLIADNGIGIKTKNEKRIFETMFREDKSRNKEGSGLGLAIVDKLVSAHGGNVRAYNKSGLTIEITLPIEEVPTGDQA